MSTRDRAIEIIDLLSEEQLQGFIMMFQGYVEDIPNEETIEAMKEAEEIAKDPNVKGYSSIAELMEALDAE